VGVWRIGCDEGAYALDATELWLNATTNLQQELSEYLLHHWERLHIEGRNNSRSCSEIPGNSQNVIRII